MLSHIQISYSLYFLANNLLDIDMPIIKQWCTQAAAQSHNQAPRRGAMKQVPNRIREK